MLLLLLSLLVIILFLFLLLSYRYDPDETKGVRGEARVARELRALQDEDFQVFNDVLLKTQRGTSQIDHVVISTYGIFVIETKNYSGWIHGNENSEYWTQTLYRTKSKFRNPIKQNWAHIYALKEVLSDFRQVSYHSIVVFSGDAELKNISSRIPIIYSHELIGTIRDTRGIHSLSVEQVADIADRLSIVSIQDREAKREHVYHVKAQIHERRQKEFFLICPRCGGNLVVRKGQYGKFYGCSNYPKCKYTLTCRSDQY